jgi:peptidoglycan/LPS O-acetylase OafA/YrhL
MLEASIKTPHFFDPELEGLRGFAALGVMFYHGVGTRGLDVAYKPEGFLAYLSLSGLGVYLFFVLSGYVIGINYQNRSTFKTGLYLKKRLVRLYPLYLISFLSILVLATPTLFQKNGECGMH